MIFTANGSADSMVDLDGDEKPSGHREPHFREGEISPRDVISHQPSQISEESRNSDLQEIVQPSLKSPPQSKPQSEPPVSVQKPFFIMDFLEEIDPEDLELAQKMLKTPKNHKSMPDLKEETARRSQLKPIRKKLFSTGEKPPLRPLSNSKSANSFFERSVQVGNAYNAKGIKKARQGKWEEAVKAWENALNIRTQVLGAFHPDVANMCNNLGIALGKLGRIDEAVQQLRRALVIRKKHWGEQHTEVAAVVHNLGNVLQQAEDLGAALQCYTESRLIHQQGDDLVLIARDCIAIGHTYSQARALVDAREAYVDALCYFEESGLAQTDAEVTAVVQDIQNIDEALRLRFHA
jgi:tetratricopeptide (TPR) repeat protein